jgi:hypothetical protein
MTRQLEKEPGEDCLSLRGALGKWVLDLGFAANEGSYKKFLNHSLGLTDQYFHELREEGMLDSGFRKATTWRWEDRYCPIDYVNRSSLCDVLSQLNVKRLFFIGDELTLAQALSLFMLMNDRSITIESDSYFQRTIQCPPDGGNFSIEYIRNDELSESTKSASLEDGTTNCCDGKAYCYPYSSNYTKFEGDGSTVVIANTGLHQTSESNFQKSVIRFLKQMAGFGQSKDWVFMRSSVPGHVYCDEPGITPFGNIEGFFYRKSRYDPPTGGGVILSAYNFTLICDYNRLLKESLKTFERAYILDVFPMTAIRPDGHLSENELYRAKSLPTNDCVQYGLPGKSCSVVSFQSKRLCLECASRTNPCTHMNSRAGGLVESPSLFQPQGFGCQCGDFWLRVDTII